ncbi:MAG: recombinase [Burkholderiales bacterium]
MAAEHAGLDWLVGGARADAPLAERLEWLEQLAAWIRAGHGGGEGHATPATRLRFLLQVLDRNPERRAEIGRVLRGTLREMDAIGLLCETGLPRAHAFLPELFERLVAKLVPFTPAPNDLAALFRRLFPRAADGDWVAELPAPVLAGIAELLAPPEAEPLRPRQDAADALAILASHVQAIGMSQRVRRRTAHERPLATPFATLSTAVHEYLEATPGSDDAAAARAALMSHIARCTRALGGVVTHLESYGVSIDLVFQAEFARLALARMSALVEFRADPPPAPAEVAGFMAALIRANAANASVRALLAENSVLLARRIVESARRTGEHYITRDGAEYRAMLVSAAIGGAVTGVTVLVKLAVSGHGLAPFVEGLVASLNYAASFVLIHFLHGTLATKQPAMTAATMAQHLAAEREPGRIRAFVADVAGLVRSQMAAIAGNLVLVVPAALVLQALLLAVGGDHLPDRDHALHYVGSLSVFSATPVFAAFTGVLLWLSALCAGWFENWAAYRDLPGAIARSPRLARWAGPARARRLAEVVGNNVAALGGNVSLGFLLGMVPMIALFFGVPLEVRHVTLSTGQLALAAWAHGAGVFLLPVFWLAVAGIGVIGFLNLTVSFSLAMWVAIRSVGRGEVSRRRLVRAVLAHLVASPRDFFLPPAAAGSTNPGDDGQRPPGTP